MMKYSIKFDDLNLYLCSLTLGLLEYMLHSRNFSLGIWTLGIPMFREGLKNKDIDNRLINIIEKFDEFSSMQKLDLDVDSIVKNKINIVKQIMDDLQCYNDVNQIKLEELK